jgi:hypothetical protein
MTVRFFYVDESYDNQKYCLSAISIRHSDWRACQDTVRQHRILLKDQYGMFIRKEIHATEFVAGRGRISEQTIGKHQRSRIFSSLLGLVAQLPNSYIINVCLDIRGRRDPQMDAWDRMVNRIERTMAAVEGQEMPLRRSLLSSARDELSREEYSRLEDRILAYRPRAVIVADQGRESEITKALRRMSVYNPVPSQYGQWGGGRRAQNIAVQRIIEDPVFKQSHQSYMIQLADCVAYSLLKREVEPTANVKKYGIHKMFDAQLAGSCFTKASPRDPLGIVRN